MSPVSVQVYLLLILWLSGVSGHSRQINAVHKRITAVRDSLITRIDEIGERLSDIEKYALQNRGDSLSQTIRNEFELHYKKEILDTLEQEMRTSIAGKLVKEIVDEVSLNINANEYVEMKQELQTLRLGLDIQKEMLRYLDSKLEIMLSFLEKKGVSGDAQVCFDLKTIASCVKNDFNITKTTPSTVTVTTTTTTTTTPSPSTESSLSDTTTPPTTEPPTTTPKPNPPLRTVMVADYIVSERHLQMIDVQNSTVKPSPISLRRVLSIAYHPPRGRLFYAVKEEQHPLRSILLDGTANAFYFCGEDKVAKLALDVPNDLVIYLTDYPWYLKLLNIQGGNRFLKEFRGSERPKDITVDINHQSVYVVVRRNDGSTSIQCFDYSGQKKDLPHLSTDNVFQPITALGTDGDTLWFNKGRQLMNISLKRISESPNLVGNLTDVPDDFEVWYGTCVVGYKNQHNIDMVSIIDGVTKTLESVEGHGRRSRSISLIG